MLSAPLHPQESERLQALRALNILDTGAEERFDRITRTARRLFGVPTALVSLVDEHRQWFKSKQGLEACETPRDVSFCGHAIIQTEALVVEDAHGDPRFQDNPLVTAPPFVRFYAGHPLFSRTGLPLGTLCLLDSAPRSFDPEAQAGLADLAAWAQRELQQAELVRELGRREALDAGAAFRHSILQNAWAAIISTDLEGTVTSFNPCAERLLGYTAENVVGRVTPALWHDPEEIRRRAKDLSEELGIAVPPSFEAFVAKARTGVVDQQEWNFLHRDGARIPVILAISAIRDDQGQLQGFLGVATDLRELKASQSQYQLLAERTTDIIARHGVDGTFQFVTPAVKTILGFAPEDLIGRAPTDFLVPEDVPTMARVHFGILRGEHPGTFRYRARHKDGHPVWLESAGNPVRDPATGAVLETIYTSRDISERVEGEQALRRSEARSRALVDALPDLLFRVDRGGTLLEVHAPSPDLRDLFPETLVGEAAEAVLPAPLAETLRTHLPRTLETGAGLRFEYVLDFRGRPEDFEARMVPCGGNEVLLILRDISERKLVERMKNEFVSTVSHELRTPLTAIRGSLGLLLGGVAGPMPPQAEELLTIGQKNADRLVRLINDLLDLEKIERGQLTFQLQDVELRSLVDQTLQSLDPLAAELGVGLEFRSEAPDLRARVDPDRFIQVLINITSNALKFSPRGEPVHLRLLQVGGRARLEVEDHGPGIPESFQSRIFQRFAQADSTNTRGKGGTGLGLSIAQALVERMDGRVGFQSRPGRTVFWAELPLVAQRPSPRFLVVEDDPACALVLRTLLMEGGAHVDVAGSAQQARDLLAEHRYEAATLDLGLPDLDGLSLLREVRQDPATADLPVLVVSGTRSRLGDPSFGTLHILDWVEKPVNPRQVLEAIRRALVVEEDRPRILHVEDSEDIAVILRLMLRDTAEVHQVVSLRQAREALMAWRPSLVVLDLALPDGWGLDLLPDLERLPGSPIPVLVFSAHEPDRDSADRLAAILVKSRTTETQLRAAISSLLPAQSEFQELP